VYKKISIQQANPMLSPEIFIVEKTLFLQRLLIAMTK
jgi:hypothetical protein